MGIGDRQGTVTLVIARGEWNLDPLYVSEARALAVHILSQQMYLVLVEKVLHTAHVHELENAAWIISMLLRHTKGLFRWHVLMCRDQLRLFLPLGGPLDFQPFVFDFQAV